MFEFLFEVNKESILDFCYMLGILCIILLILILFEVHINKSNKEPFL